MSASRPAVTNPSLGSIAATFSTLETTTCVNRLRARRATRSASKLRSASPVRTDVARLHVRREALSLEQHRVETDMDDDLEPARGERHGVMRAMHLQHAAHRKARARDRSSGRSTRRRPTRRCANAGSGTRSSGTMMPERGATMMSGSPPEGDVADVVLPEFCIVTCTLGSTCLRYQPDGGEPTELTEAEAGRECPSNIMGEQPRFPSVRIRVVIGPKRNGRLAREQARDIVDDRLVARRLRRLQSRPGAADCAGDESRGVETAETRAARTAATRSRRAR